MSATLEQRAFSKILRADPPRSEPRVTLEIDSRCANLAVAGIAVEYGKQRVEVYESDVPAIKALVESEDLTPARKRLSAFQEAMAAKKAGKPVPDVALPKATPSLEACFRDIHFRDLLPLVSVTRIDAPAPSKR